VSDRRACNSGSFASHFDELVVQFPDRAPARSGKESMKRSEELQERLDIHALLFERAWQMREEG
jgi:hypothetical protein